MTDRQEKNAETNIELDYELDATPQKVWRAISISQLRENWLPAKDLADAEAISARPGEEITYRMRKSEPPFLESMVTFRIFPNADGGTRLRIIHELKRTGTVAANSNHMPLMRAA